MSAFTDEQRSEIEQMIADALVLNRLQEQKFLSDVIEGIGKSREPEQPRDPHIPGEAVQS